MNVYHHVVCTVQGGIDVVKSTYQILYQVILLSAWVGENPH